MQFHPFQIFVPKNQRGQGLIEYLIIVALMGVATIAIVRVMGQAVSGRFANVTKALQGDPDRVKPVTIRAEDYQKKDLSNFFQGADGNGK